MDFSYVKLFRKSLESTVFQNANLWQVWSYCIMRANHKTTTVLFEGKEIILQPGQFICGRYEGSKACKMKPSTFRNQINRLKQLKTLDTKSDNKKSIITIVNWTRYQGSMNLQDNTLDTSLDNKRTQTRSKEINTYKFTPKTQVNDFELSFKGN